jgi:hypothetical protein
MKFSGSASGKSGKHYRFNKGEIIDAPQGEFNDSIAEASEKVEKKVSKKVVETASVKRKSEKR